MRPNGIALHGVIKPMIIEYRLLNTHNLPCQRLGLDHHLYAVKLVSTFLYAKCGLE